VRQLFSVPDVVVRVAFGIDSVKPERKGRDVVGCDIALVVVALNQRLFLYMAWWMIDRLFDFSINIAHMPYLIAIEHVVMAPYPPRLHPTRLRVLQLLSIVVVTEVAFDDRLLNALRPVDTV